MICGVNHHPKFEEKHLEDIQHEHHTQMQQVLSFGNLNLEV